MRVQCCICQDLLEANSDREVVALPCGHVFHSDCVLSWMTKGPKATCPECRRTINVNKDMTRLYFNLAELDPGEVDPNKMKNELDQAKLDVKKKEREKQELRDQCRQKEEQLDESAAVIESVRQMYAEEKASTHALKKELASYQRQISDAKLAREDAKQVRRKLEQMQAIENLIKGSEAEAEAIIDTQGDSRSLATWCAMLKRELHEKKRETRALREEQDKTRRENATRDRLLQQRATQLKAMQDKQKQMEEDLASSDKIITSQKKKLEALLQSINSPSGVNAHLRQRLIAESPAPSLSTPPSATPPNKRQKTDTPGELNITLDLFPDLDNDLKESPSVEVKRKCQDYGAKYVKISSLSSKSGHREKRELSDSSNVVPPGYNFNILKKKTGFGGAQSRTIRQGYDGMGSHEKFVQPMGLGKPLGKSLQDRPTAKKVAKPLQPNKRAPPLPSLSGFLNPS